MELVPTVVYGTVSTAGSIHTPGTAAPLDNPRIVQRVLVEVIFKSQLAARLENYIPRQENAFRRD